MYRIIFNFFYTFFICLLCNIIELHSTLNTTRRPVLNNNFNKVVRTTHSSNALIMKKQHMNNDIKKNNRVRQKIARFVKNNNQNAKLNGISNLVRTTQFKRNINGLSSKKQTTQNRVARSTINIINQNLNGSKIARTTAVFNDVSKIGGGFAECRESYNTCMDQICSKANETYKRCVCSDRFLDFKEMEANINKAKDILYKFSNNNMNAVNKTADEVSAMYSATEGEKAIKNDPSAAASMLSEIGALLNSGNALKKQNNGFVKVDFSTDMDDLWGENEDTNLSNKEGVDLLKSADKQCTEIVQNTCPSQAVLSMTKSAYNIIVGQDCNAYEKFINKQNAKLKETVRNAEKTLRKARLEEYKSHNSADVSECITKVKAKMQEDVVCGKQYFKCLDYTGKYIDLNTGKALYSAHLFELRDLIKLGDANILDNNQEFNKFLDDKKMYVEKELDSCRNIADDVWIEFKKVALIEIAQSQDEKIEEIKDSCVNTMKQCYDKQLGALKSFSEEAQSGGALSRYTAKSMCEEQVIACASIYAKEGDPKCEFDTHGQPKNTCGLTALLNFVNTVDTVIVSKECKKDIESYAKTTCKLDDDFVITEKSPCQTMYKPEVEKLIKDKAILLCFDTKKTKEEVQESLVGDDKNTQKYNNPNYDKLEEEVKIAVEDVLNKIESAINVYLEPLCGEDGFWIPTNYTGIEDISKMEIKKKFFTDNFNGSENVSWGRCVENNALVRCNMMIDELKQKGQTENLMSYNESKLSCDMNEQWFEQQCRILGDSYYENGTCYVKPKEK